MLAVPGLRSTLGEADAEGFRGWVISADHDGRFTDVYTNMRARVEPGDKVRCRVDTDRAKSNLIGAIHGGYIAAFVDQILFVAPMALQRVPHGGVTLSLSTQFVAPGRPGEPLDAVCEVAGETGKLVFTRGTIEQAFGTVATFEGILRKRSSPWSAPEGS